MYYFEALDIANGLVEAMRPYCNRIEIAGSLRRKKPIVKDIEIVAIPKWENRPAPHDLFSTPVPTNLLHLWATMDAHFAVINKLERVIWIKPGATPVPWTVAPEGKYWRGLIPPDFDLPFAIQLEEGIKLDLFLCKPDTWGVIFLMRTGSAEFSNAVMTRALQRQTPVREGYVTNFGKPLAMPEEKDVFDFLGLQFIPPEKRTGKEAVKPKPNQG